MTRGNREGSPSPFHQTGKGAAGASSKIAQSRVRRVVMISCDPATLARDTLTLVRTRTFQITAIESFEMFPHTSHAETIVVLDRTSKKI